MSPSRRYEVRHRTAYTYAGEVTASYGWAYLTPRDLPGQACRSTRVEVEPGPALLSESVDFFGNRATYLEVHEPHRELVVTATSQVEIDRTVPDLTALDVWTWEQARDLLRAQPRADREEVGFAQASPRLPLRGPVREPLAAFTAGVLAPGRPLGEALQGLVHAIHGGFRFRSGATTVSSTLVELFDRREGVCQDFAHLAVAALRLAGLPARYVSGYLETLPPPGRPKLTGVDASHAWVSVLVPEVGWVDLDPTNDQQVDDAYVVTAWGRDYSDVPPLKGVIFTEGAGSGLTVAVDVTRLP